MSRRLLAPVVLLASLLLVAAASAAGKADGATVTVASTGNNQVVFQVQNTGDTVISSFVLVPGPGFTASSVSGRCQLSGGTISCTGLALAPGCTCMAGESVNVTVTGAGDPAGSSVVQIVSTLAPAANSPSSISNPVQVVTPTSATKPQAAKVKATNAAKPQTAKAKRKVPLCKKGQHSTKTKPCHR